MQLYIDAWIEFNDVMTGKKKPGPSAAFQEEAKRRKEEHARKQTELVPVTPEEMGWNEDA